MIESKPFFVEEDLQLGVYWSAVPEKNPWVYLFKITVTGTGDNHSGGGGRFSWWLLEPPPYVRVFESLFHHKIKLHILCHNNYIKYV